MRAVPLLLVMTLPLVAAEPAKPAVTFGTTALLAKNNSANVFCVLFSPDSGSVGLFDSTGLRYWSLDTARATVSRFENDGAEVSRMFVAGDGRSLIVYSEGEKQKLARVDLVGEEIKELKLNARPDALFVSECGHFAAIESKETLRIFRTTDGETAVEFPGVVNVRRFSASTNGRAFAWCDRNGNVQLREPGQPAWSPPRPSRRTFSSVALSPDGARMATASYTVDDQDSARKNAGPIQIWSVADRKLLATCEAADWFAEFPNRLRFTPDGKTLLAGDGAYLRGWNAATGKLTFAVEPGWNYPGPIIVSPDSRYVAVAYPKRGLVWDLTTGKPPPGFEGHTGPVWDLVFSPDGRRAATSSYGFPHAMIWNAPNGALLHHLNTPYAPAWKMPDLPERTSQLPTQLGTVPYGPDAHLHPDHPSNRRKAPLNAETVIPGRVRLGFSLDGNHFATVNEASGSAGPLRVWDVATGRKLWERAINLPFAPQTAFTRHGLFISNDDRLAFLQYGAATGDVVWKKSHTRFELHEGIIIDRDGDRLALTTSRAEDSLIVDSKSGDVLARFSGIPQAISADGRSVTILKLGPSMTDGAFLDQVVVRDLATGKESKPQKIPMGQALGQLSPDAEFRVVSKWDGHADAAKRAFEFREVDGDRPVAMTFRVDLNDGDENQLRMMMMMTAPHRPAAFAFSPDNRLFAAVYATGKLAVWETATGEEVLVTDTNCLSPKFVAFSPDSRRVFTASGEGAGGPVFGYDTAEPLKEANAGSLSHPVWKSRGAVYALATKPAEAVAIAKSILAPATEVDLVKYDRWISNLDAAAFDDREAATNALAEAGWRAESKLKDALATTGSAEARQRLSGLLARRDQRPLRVVQLLELAGTKEAHAVLAKVAAATPETFLSREARRALARMP